MDIKNFKSYVHHVATGNRSIMIEGVLGCGKSQVIRELSEMRRERLGLKPEEYGWYDLRLSYNDAGDLKGYPFLLGGRTWFAPPAWFPLHPEDKVRLKAMLEEAGHQYVETQPAEYGDLFLDEFNRGQPEAMDISFQIVLDHRLGDWRMAPGWRVFAAQNPAGGSLYKVRTLDPALTSRFDLIEFKPSLEDFRVMGLTEKVLDGRKVQRIHPVVLAYLEAHDEFLDPSDEVIRRSVADGGTQVHNRRAWEELGDKLYHLDFGVERGEHNIVWSSKENAGMLLEAVKATVGSMVSVSFVDFVAKQYKVLTPKNILEGWSDDTAKQVKESNPSEITTLSTNLVKTIMEGEVAGRELKGKKLDNFRSYIMAVGEHSGEMASHLWATPSSLVASGAVTGVSQCRALMELYRKDPEVKALFVRVMTGGAVRA